MMKGYYGRQARARGERFLTPLCACLPCLLIGCGPRDSAKDEKQRSAFIPVRTVLVQIEPGSVLEGREKEIESALAKDFGAISPPRRAQVGRGLIISLHFDNTQDHCGALLEVSADFRDLEDSIATGIASTSLDTSAEAAMNLVRKTGADGAKAMKELVSLVDAGDAELVSELSSAEPDEQIVALDLIGHRGLSRYIPEIARLLKDPRPRVADAAAETLVEIGDRRAVPLLIESIDREDLRSEVRAVEAMGKIGGEEARAYLEMTAMGHEVPEVRSLSEVLLRRIRSNEKKSNKSL